MLIPCSINELQPQTLDLIDHCSSSVTSLAWHGLLQHCLTVLVDPYEAVLSQVTLKASALLYPLSMKSEAQIYGRGLVHHNKATLCGFSNLWGPWIYL